MLLYFVKSKNGTKCKNFAVLLFYVNAFILLYFLRFQERGLQAYSPLNHPLIINLPLVVDWQGYW